jgi:GNAT superfamily N-acetyltransferase
MARPQHSTVALRDGRPIRLSAPSAADEEDIATLLEITNDPRGELFARAAAARGGGDGAALIARADHGGVLVGYAAWIAGSSGLGEFVGAVDPAFAGLGLGTLLLRAAAIDALAAGRGTLRVELSAGARALAAMLRDCGLCSYWDLEHPVARVDLVLDSTRPGWATPVLAR